MHDSRLIANKFLERASQDGKTLTPMQLLKLVYIAHGWMLGLYSIPIIRDRVEAWKFGPVIPQLYNAIRKYGSSPVLEPINSDDDELTLVEENLLDQVFEKYGSYTGTALSRLTHKPNTPWARVFQPGMSNILIPDDIIEEHYQSLSNK